MKCECKLTPKRVSLDEINKVYRIISYQCNSFATTVNIYLFLLISFSNSGALLLIELAKHCQGI